MDPRGWVTAAAYNRLCVCARLPCQPKPTAAPLLLLYQPSYRLFSTDPSSCTFLCMQSAPPVPPSQHCFFLPVRLSMLCLMRSARLLLRYIMSMLPHVVQDESHSSFAKPGRSNSRCCLGLAGTQGAVPRGANPAAPHTHGPFRLSPPRRRTASQAPNYPSGRLLVDQPCSVLLVLSLGHPHLFTNKISGRRNRVSGLAPHDDAGMCPASRDGLRSPASTHAAHMPKGCIHHPPTC